MTEAKWAGLDIDLTEKEKSDAKLEYELFKLRKEGKINPMQPASASYPQPSSLATTSYPQSGKTVLPSSSTSISRPPVPFPSLSPPFLQNGSNFTVNSNSNSSVPSMQTNVSPYPLSQQGASSTPPSSLSAPLSQPSTQLPFPSTFIHADLSPNWSSPRDGVTVASTANVFSLLNREGTSNRDGFSSQQSPQIPSQYQPIILRPSPAVINAQRLQLMERQRMITERLMILPDRSIERGTLLNEFVLNLNRISSMK